MGAVVDERLCHIGHVIMQCIRTPQVPITTPWHVEWKIRDLIVALPTSDTGGGNDTVRMQQLLKKSATVHDPIARAMGIDNPNFLVFEKRDAWTEYVAYPRMILQNLHISPEYVRSAQAVVSGDQPNILSTGEFDPLVVITQVAQVRLIPNISDSWIGKRARHLRSVVRRTVVHNQHFKILIGLGEDGVHAFRKQMRKSVARNYK